jgi:hypothetical protein
MKLIISGVPCTGKTHFGDWLRDELQFVHHDLGRKDKEPIHFRVSRVLDAVRNRAESGRDAVVTWGFMPEEVYFQVVREFWSLGYVPWWFDADPVVARMKYAERDGISATQRAFDPQIVRLESAQARIDRFYGNRRIETLDILGRHLECERIFDCVKRHPSSRGQGEERRPAGEALTPSPARRE